MLASYDREKLYQEVWAEPTQNVAARYSISDVALSRHAGIADPETSARASGKEVGRASCSTPAEALAVENVSRLSGYGDMCRQGRRQGATIMEATVYVAV